MPPGPRVAAAVAAPGNRSRLSTNRPPIWEEAGHLIVFEEQAGEADMWFTWKPTWVKGARWDIGHRPQAWRGDQWEAVKPWEGTLEL